MRGYTTPTLTITIKNKDGTVATDLIFDYVLLTLENASTIIEKKVLFEDVTEGVFEVEYTQEETGKLKPGTMAKLELNIMAGEKRMASVIKQLTIAENLHKGVL